MSKLKFKGSEYMRTRIVRTRVLADALVWLGFKYTKDDEGNFIFERNRRFNMAWRDLHYLRTFYSSRE